MRGRIRSSGIVALVAAIGLLAGVQAGAERAQAAGATNCVLSTDEQRSLGASYVTSLKVRGVGCKDGKTLVKAFHKCRKQNGGADGHCSAVNGFQCREGERNTVPGVQYDTRATCKRDGAKVIHTYSQFI